ncbi:hypothetical protein C8R47DRAFT_1137033, partial [Mycena vitilis]
MIILFISAATISFYLSSSFLALVNHFGSVRPGDSCLGASSDLPRPRRPTLALHSNSFSTLRQCGGPRLPLGSWRFRTNGP